MERDRQRSMELFRRERLEEPVEKYSIAFDDYQGEVEDLLESTVDLSDLSDDKLIEIFKNPRHLEAFRYLSGPPISDDDLRTLVDAVTLSPASIASDPGLLERVRSVVVDCLDRRRFPWYSERRDPTEAERGASVLASAALLAYRHIQTWRRTQGKLDQEARVKEALLSIGLRFLAKAPKKIETASQAPKPGEFCAERFFSTRKADFIVGLWDTRHAPIECKVSNSELNSVKRLNNDAAQKAEVWKADFGVRNVVPMAVLSGVYKLKNLLEAQERGLTIFWAHDLQSLLDWIRKTRQ